MNLSLIPDHAFRRISDISPEFLHTRGITLLLLDLDNTVAPYYAQSVEKGIARWRNRMTENGIDLYFVSNSKSKGRVEAFAKALGIGFITDAGKPSASSITRAIEECNRETRHTALIGDQIFTDILGANIAGITSIIVDPITFKPLCWQNVLRRLRYYAELPIRALCGNKTWRI